MATQNYRLHGTVPATAWRVEERRRFEQGAICTVYFVCLSRARAFWSLLVSLLRLETITEHSLQRDSVTQSASHC